MDNAGNIEFVSEENGRTTFRVDVKDCPAGEFSKQLFFEFANKKIPIISQRELEEGLEGIFVEATKNSEEKEEKE